MCEGREVAFGVVRGGNESGTLRSFGVSLYQLHASLFWTFTFCSEYLTSPAKRERKVDAYQRNIVNTVFLKITLLRTGCF